MTEVAIGIVVGLVLASAYWMPLVAKYHRLTYEAIDLVNQYRERLRGAP